MARHVAGPIIKYNNHVFDCLQPQMLMVNDYADARLDFQGDPNLVLSKGS
jgi:hypothetical protein